MWEDTWAGWDKNTTTLAVCRKHIERACKRFGIKPPIVKQHDTNAVSWSTPQKNIISMQGYGPDGLGGLNVPIALHEAAHHIIYHRVGLRPQDHGPTFLGVYLWLLENAKVASGAALRASAKTGKLKWREIHPLAMK